MKTLRQILKEFLELDDATIDAVLAEVEVDWTAFIHNVVDDMKATKIIEGILGTKVQVP